MSFELPDHAVRQKAAQPPALGLFEKRIEGDDSLMELARLRFAQAGLGTEIHGGTPEQIESVLRFRPSSAAAVTVHLPRDFNLMDEDIRGRIAALAARFAGRVLGFVLHDHQDLVARRDDYLRSAIELDARLARIEGAPKVFIEYAVGLDPDVFAEFFGTIRELARLSACVDTGHVGIRQARQTYAKAHPGVDVCALKFSPERLPALIEEVDAAVRSALPAVLNLMAQLGALGKPVHFHLHDGHPLSTFSPFGVSDHLSFQAEIPLAVEFRGQRSAPLLFGPAGLARLAATALETIGRERASFTLEIHPTFDRLPLGDAAELFGHWRDTTNAERMNHWLSVLAQNHALLQDALRAAGSGPAEAAPVPA